MRWKHKKRSQTVFKARELLQSWKFFCHFFSQILLNIDQLLWTFLKKCLILFFTKCKFCFHVHIFQSSMRMMRNWFFNNGYNKDCYPSNLQKCITFWFVSLQFHTISTYHWRTMYGWPCQHDFWKLHSWLITEILQNRMHSQCKGPQSSQIGVLVASGIIPRYIKHPALIAPRILAAVSDEVATEAPTTTPMKLMHATVHFVSRMHMDISKTSITAFKCAQDKLTKCYAYRQDWSLGIAPRMHPPSKW